MPSSSLSLSGPASMPSSRLPSASPSPFGTLESTSSPAPPPPFFLPPPPEPALRASAIRTMGTRHERARRDDDTLYSRCMVRDIVHGRTNALQGPLPE